jgi:hypothetical protein
MFFDFLKIEEDLTHQTEWFVNKVREDPRWAQERLIECISFQNDRAREGISWFISHILTQRRYQTLIVVWLFRKCAY